MANLMVSGSRFIRSLNEKAVAALEDVCHKHPELDHLIVGDAAGVDTLIQDLVGGYMTVFATKRGVRNYIHRDHHRTLELVGRTYTERDEHMTELCSVHFGYVTNKQPCNGTRANHRRALQQGKVSYLYNVDTESFE